MIPLFKVFMSPGLGQEIEKVLQSGYVGQGTVVDQFEQSLQDYLGNPFVNTVNSATSGLSLALHLIKESGRDEVVSTPLTCTATNWAILAAGFKIKWADIDRRTLNIDPEDALFKITPRTAAIMAVHWGGNACDLSALKKIQETTQRAFEFSPPIIEDCSHGWGATYKNKLLGNHGNLAVYSFQAIKHFSTVDGGLVVAPNYDLYKRAKLLRWYGLDRDSNVDFRCEQNIKEWGFKYHMNDVNATIGLGNLPHSMRLVEEHRRNAAYYHEKLKRVPGFNPIQHLPDRNPSYWVYSALVDKRQDFTRKMKEAGIATSMVHSRNDKHDCVKEFSTILPEMDFVSERLVCIPCGWWLSTEDREHIVDTIRSGW